MYKQEDLRQILMSENQETRLEAVIALGKLGDEQSLKLLKNKFEDKSESGTIRANAFFAIVQAQKDDLPFELVKKALEDEDGSVRNYAIFALRFFGSKSSELLLTYLQRDNWEEKSAAAIVLGEVGDIRAVEPLTNALKDNNKSVRAWAAVSLGKLKDKRAIEPLIVALNDKEAMVRYHVVGALGQFDDPNILRVLNNVVDNDKDIAVDEETVSEAAARAIVRIQKRNH